MCCQAWGSYLAPRIAFIVPPTAPPPKPLPGYHSPSDGAAVGPVCLLRPILLISQNVGSQMDPIRADPLYLREITAILLKKK